MSRSDQKKFYDKIGQKVGKNIREFWKHINSLSKSNSVPQFICQLQRLYTSASITENTNLFAAFFKTTYSSPRFILNFDLLDQEDILNNCAVNFNNNVTESDIILALNKLGDGVSLGADGLPEVFVAKCGSSLIYPLLILYNQSLSNGLFPTVWKRTFITPVFKSGDRTDVTNYRPISVIGSLAKIFDSIVALKLSESLISFIISEQHRFVKTKSTLSNLLDYCNFISESLNSCCQVDSIYLDFKKAFDSVNHDILIRKLHSLGLRGIMLRWLKSYMSKREQVVRIKGNCSDPFLIESGVPQGSHLGPLLFILFINDVKDKLTHSRILIFADDIKLFNKISSPLDRTKLQIDLDKIVKWPDENELNLNIQKCTVINIHRGDFFDTNYYLGDIELT